MRSDRPPSAVNGSRAGATQTGEGPKNRSTRRRGPSRWRTGSECSQLSTSIKNKPTAKNGSRPRSLRLMPGLWRGRRPARRGPSTPPRRGLWSAKSIWDLSPRSATLRLVMPLSKAGRRTTSRKIIGDFGGM